MAECLFEVQDYRVAGDNLIIRTDYGYKKLVLPFIQESENGDFQFYKAIDSALPSPLSSISDFLPKNKLEPLAEFASYPSCQSSLLCAAVLPESGRITQAFD